MKRSNFDESSRLWPLDLSAYFNIIALNILSVGFRKL